MFGSGEREEENMSTLRTAILIGLAAFSITARGQFPYGASDTTYGLRSRIAENPAFQYTPSPADWRDINMYQLFTDRFADGDSSNNKAAWDVGSRSFPQNRNFHHGGDWKGLKNNLDYLSGMGVKAIWMSGVQMNDQGKDLNYTPYHMYHPTDFFRTDPTSGTFQELKDLIDACHARGIYVVLDVVVNHTADKNGVDGDTGYYANGGNNFRWWNNSNQHAAPFNDLQWFHNNGTINCWDCSPENLLGQFKGTDDLKTENATVQGWLTDAFKNLIDATDCDGFRVDAIKHVEYNWIKKWADDMRKHAVSRGKNDFILFGEYFSYDNGALSSYCKDAGYSFNSALFFPLSQNIKNVFVDNGGPSQLTQQLNQKSQYGEGADRLVAFIDNHDLNRIALMNGGDNGNDVWKLRPALSFLYLATPVPCLYYGTEHAFDQGGHYNGSNKTQDNPDDGDWQRETMFDRGFQPGPAQGNKLAATTAPLYLHIKALNQARNDHKSLTRGSFTERWSDGAYAFSRVYDSEESLVAINLQDGSKSINPTVSKPDGTEFVNALNASDKVTVSGGKISFSMTGKETKVYVAGITAPQMWVRGTHNSPGRRRGHRDGCHLCEHGSRPDRGGDQREGGLQLGQRHHLEPDFHDAHQLGQPGRHVELRAPGHLPGRHRDQVLHRNCRRQRQQEVGQQQRPELQHHGEAAGGRVGAQRAELPGGWRGHGSRSPLHQCRGGSFQHAQQRAHRLLHQWHHLGGDQHDPQRGLGFGWRQLV
jgi:glycosidase